MEELKSRVNSLVQKYEELLSEKGITVKVSKRYFETDVEAGYSYSGDFDFINRALDEKAEKKKGYNRIRNRYHSIILHFLPIEKTLLSREECKEYAFVTKKVERAHFGLEPRCIEYEENKVISKIEKRIDKILKKAQRTSALNLCKNTVFDALRYTVFPNYKHKKKFCGRDRYFWDILFTVCLVVALAVILLAIALCLSLI